MLVGQFPLEKVQQVVDFVWNNKHASLYTDFWHSTGITCKPEIRSYDDFVNIPTISREQLNTPLHPSGRCFTDLSHAHVLAYTSGTTSRRPLFMWRHLHPHPHSFANFNLYQRLGFQRVMIFGGHHRLGAENARDAGLSLVYGDPQNLKQSINIMDALAIDSIVLPPTLALLLAEELHKTSGTDAITGVALYGEYCSDMTYKLVRKHYPNAKLTVDYGLTEAALIIASGLDTCTQPNRIMHFFNDDCLIEVVDNEILITTLLLPHCFPLLRYKTGDAAELLEQQCDCSEKTQCVSLLGRINKDFIHISAGRLSVEELDRVIEPFLPYIELSYTLVVEELEKHDTRVGVLTLQATKKENVSMPTSFLTQYIQRHVMEHLRLSQNMSLSEATAAGLLLPLDIHWVTKPNINLKQPRLQQRFR